MEESIIVAVCGHPEIYDIGIWSIEKKYDQL